MKLIITFPLAVVLTGSTQAATVLADRVVITNTTAGQTNFHIAEVQVFEQGTATNVSTTATGASATASSTGFGTFPSRAIDNNTDGIFGNGSTWHDGDAAEGDTLTVVFSAPKNVDSFQIWGRSDCCTERDDSIRVEFFNGANLVGQNDTGIGPTFNTGLQQINAIPEPGLAGLVAGSVLLSLRRRRKG